MLTVGPAGPLKVAGPLGICPPPCPSLSAGLGTPLSRRALKETQTFIYMLGICTYLSPQTFARNQILLDYSGQWRDQSCQFGSISVQTVNGH